MSRALTRGDDTAIDAGVRWTARFGAWLAATGSAFIEMVADGAGTDLRRLETGLAHHYLVWVAASAVLMIVIVLLGA